MNKDICTKLLTEALFLILAKWKKNHHAFINSNLMKSAMMHPHHGIPPSTQEE